MPWPTTDGLRNLSGAEADLVRGAIGMMVDTHVAELREDAVAWEYGVEWFDQWDVGQRLWLLEQVTRAFFGTQQLDSAAAMFDAAADAVFYEILDLIQIEIEQGALADSDRSWRQSVVQAFEWQRCRPSETDAESQDLDAWRTMVTQIADSILGIRLYRRAEGFRDVDYERTRTFL